MTSSRRISGGPAVRPSGRAFPSASWSAVLSSSGASSTAKAASAAATPSIDAWNLVPIIRSGRYASGASSRMSSAVVRSSEPPSSRSPIGTATSASDSDAHSSSTSDDRKATRSVRMVAERCAPATCRITSAWCLARPKARSVGSPRTTSRKWPPSRASAWNCRSVTALVCRPTSAPNTGISGSVTSTMSALVRSAANTRISTASGTTPATATAGR